MDEFEKLLGEYFDCGVLEGRERRNHDTPDGAAQKTLGAIRDCVRRMIEDEREACAKLADSHFIFGNFVAGPYIAAVVAKKIRERSND